MPVPPWHTRPPIVAEGALVGMRGIMNPRSRSARSRSAMTDAGPAVAASACSSTDTSPFMRYRSTTTPPDAGTAPPYPDDADPRGTSGRPA